MSTQEREKNSFQIYLKQYEQCWQDKRAYDAMIWQTPAVFLAIVGVIVAAIISRGFPSVATDSGTRLVTLAMYSMVLLLAFAISLVDIIQLRKHRFFSDTRVNDLRLLEGFLYQMGATQNFYWIKFKRSISSQILGIVTSRGFGLTINLPTIGYLVQV